MKHPQIFFILLLAAVLTFLVSPIYADTGVLYQNAFTTDPHWTTNNPSTDYWDQAQGVYHFGISPNNQNSAYSPEIDYTGGSFTFEYDVTLQQVDQGATFRRVSPGPIWTSIKARMSLRNFPMQNLARSWYFTLSPRVQNWRK